MIVVVMSPFNRVVLDYYGASNMRTAAIVAFLVIFSALPATAEDEITSNEGSSPIGSGSTANPDDGWSKPVRGIEARISLVERPKVNGTRSIVPYLELRNVSDVANPIHVACGRDHVKFELTDSEGKVVREGRWNLSRSGPHADPGTITLPFDSSIRIGMHCTNWGVPKDAAAMIATDSGAWILQAEEKGSVFLRVTINNEAEGKSRQNWRGSLISPPKKVDWKE